MAQVEWDRYGPVRLGEKSREFWKAVVASERWMDRALGMSQGRQGMETNEVVNRLAEIIKESGNIYIAHGRRTYAISDPECPKAKVVSFVKTELEKLLVAKAPVA